MSKVAAKTAIAIALMASVGCGSSGEAEEASGEATGGGELTEYEGPIASTDVEAGKEAFDTFCGDCHPDGEEDVGPSLVADPHSPARLRQQVREGSGRMRPFSTNRLGDDQLEQILAYMASIGAVE
ncbi:MAG: cytochrome c [Myxococcales bacterium]|jgi:mono/diheme cytochrome c family protein